MISIITPTYNSEKYLEACIQSIMNQDECCYEHIIVDGGSTDGTLGIIRKYENKYPMRWISEKDNGMYDAIAKGFSMAGGDILCWINSDDMYMPWTLKTVEKVFADEKVHWVTGIPSQFTENGINYVLGGGIEPAGTWFIKRGWMQGRKLWSIQQESTFWSKELYEQSGGLDTQYKVAADYHLWKSFAEHGELYYVNSVLAGFRVHEGQLSENKDRYFAEVGRLTKVEEFLSQCHYYRIAYRIYKKVCRIFRGREYLNRNILFLYS